MTHTEMAKIVLQRLNMESRGAPDSHLLDFHTAEADMLRKEIMRRLYPAGTVNAYLYLHHGVLVDEPFSKVSGRPHRETEKEQ